jgi:hypothetical protein
VTQKEGQPAVMGMWLNREFLFDSVSHCVFGSLVGVTQPHLSLLMQQSSGQHLEKSQKGILSILSGLRGIKEWGPGAAGGRTQTAGASERGRYWCHIKQSFLNSLSSGPCQMACEVT